ncbi:MAG: citrate/2-methylcitrate synthase [Nitrospinota bacterium]
MSKALFEITEDHLDTGLRGFPVGHIWTSRVDPIKGVHYVGRPVSELCDRNPEQVMFLLLNKHLPSPQEEKEYLADLIRRTKNFPRQAIELLKHLPKDGHPMEWFIAGLIYLGMLGKKEDYEEDGLNLIAWVNELVAAIFRIREGWGDPIPGQPELGYVENFTHMLGVPDAHPEIRRVLRLFHIMHYDHGGGNLSTLTGKAVASGLADVFASMAAAMAGLYGPRHGRANQDALNFIKEVGDPDPRHVREFIQKCLDTNKLVYGFGHAVLRAEDARATIGYEVGGKFFPENRNIQIALALRQEAPPILKDTGKIANPYPNVDAITGSLLNAAGLKKSEYYSVLFGWSRTVGITAQIIDERLHFRSGRGVPIYRCNYIFEDVSKGT